MNTKKAQANLERVRRELREMSDTSAFKGDKYEELLREESRLEEIVLRLKEKENDQRRHKTEEDYPE